MLEWSCKGRIRLFTLVQRWNVAHLGTSGFVRPVEIPFFLGKQEKFQWQTRCQSLKRAQRKKSFSWCFSFASEKLAQQSYLNVQFLWALLPVLARLRKKKRQKQTANERKDKHQDYKVGWGSHLNHYSSPSLIALCLLIQVFISWFRLYVFFTREGSFW